MDNRDWAIFVIGMIFSFSLMAFFIAMYTGGANLETQKLNRRGEIWMAVSTITFWLSASALWFGICL